MHSGTRLQS